MAEASRNVACAGGQPIGATNCLNFANPQRPEIMWQFARAVEGMGAACRALDIPITGGNVSLYNETDGKGVLPTPVLGVVGLIEDADRVVRRAFRAAGDVVILLGESRDELGGSEYLKAMHGLIRGVPPSLDLAREAALAARARRGRRRRTHSVGSRLRRGWPRRHARGVLLRFVARRRRRRRSGVRCVGRVARRGDAVRRVRVARGRVGESGARRSSCWRWLRRRACRPRRIGVVGGDRIRVSVEGERVLDEPLAAAELIWSTAIEDYFERRRAVA